MNTYKKSFYFYFLTLLFGCDRIDNTLKYPLQLDAAQSIAADGESTMDITIRTADYVHPSQPMTVATTDGFLYTYPVSDLNAGQKVITVTMAGVETRVLLKSSKTPRSKVILSAKVNNLISSKEIVFTRVCPDELFLTLDDHTLNYDTNEQLSLTLELFKANGVLSDSTRIRLKTERPDLIHIPSVIYVNRSKTEKIFSKSNESADVTITAIVDSQDCRSLEQKIVVKLVP